MSFNSIKEMNTLRKEINRLFSKEMSDIYLKVLLRKVAYSKFNFISLNILSPSQFLGELQLTQI